MNTALLENMLMTTYMCVGVVCRCVCVGGGGGGGVIIMPFPGDFCL